MQKNIVLAALVFDRGTSCVRRAWMDVKLLPCQCVVLEFNFQTGQSRIIVCPAPRRCHLTVHLALNTVESHRGVLRVRVLPDQIHVVRICYIPVDGNFGSRHGSHINCVVPGDEVILTIHKC